MSLWKSRPSYSTWARVEYLYFRRIWQILVIFDSVFDSIFDLGSSNSTSIHQFYYSALTRLRSMTFRIRLDDKSGVGTPFRRYLKHRLRDYIISWHGPLKGRIDHYKKHLNPNPDSKHTTFMTLFLSFNSISIRWTIQVPDILDHKIDLCHVFRLTFKKQTFQKW